MRMTVSGLPIPEYLESLIEAGRWPGTSDEAGNLNLEFRMPANRIQRFAPEEDWIFLYPPPFGTPAQVLSESVDFHGEPDAEWPPGDIDYKKAIVIGDFGLGSDAPIALDYRHGLDCPCVIRYRWSHRGPKNRWVHVASSFEQFASMLGL